MKPNYLINIVWPSLFILLSLGCTTDNHHNTRNDAVMSRFAMTDPRVQIIGRSQKLSDGSVRFAYPGVTTRFNVKGDALWLEARSTSDQSHVDVIVDGGEPKTILLSTEVQRIPLLSESGAQKDTHQVQIIHRGETWHGTVILHNIEISGGQLLDPPALLDRRMLILGDSVTCGEAIERNAECNKNTRWWNPRLSYGMLTAHALDAQVHLVCYGGRGLVRSWNGRTDELNLPDYAELTIADATSPITWNHQDYTPDVILSAIGTNDFSQGIPDREQYVGSYVKLIERLLTLHPEAQVVLTEGAILAGEKKAALTTYLQETQRRVASPRLHILQSTHYPGDDCDAHPTKEQHAAMAADLTPELKRLMQW